MENKDTTIAVKKETLEALVFLKAAFDCGSIDEVITRLIAEHQDILKKYKNLKGELNGLEKQA